MLHFKTFRRAICMLALFLTDLSSSSLHIGRTRALRGNQITFIGGAAFQSLQTDTLDLSGNQITFIGDAAFQNLQVNNLDLSGNQLTSISNNTFDGAARVQSLSLRSNYLTKIEDSSFLAMSALHFLYVSCPEPSLPSLLMFPEPNRDLSNNILTLISPDAFAGLTALNTLKLAGNHLTSMDLVTFGNLTNLKKM
eukprot:m.730450 g.730450  ORF g.730450 m.730450 type:complete len:195 (-) comp58871_c1_seq142:1655-2239(-)